LSGYTPVFDSVYHGTLCGRWPTLPVWMTILPMADKHGRIDMTYQAMSALTGWPIELLKQAIAELTAPDPESRSSEHEGRRLELIDPESRSWGWVVVNHTKYREKARKAAFDVSRKEDGRNKERMAARPMPAEHCETADDPRSPAMTRDDPRRPAMTRAHPPSDSNSDSNSDSDSEKDTDQNQTRARARIVPRETNFPEFRAAYPAGTHTESAWLLGERAYLRCCDDDSTHAELMALVCAYADQQRAKGSVGTQFVRAPAKFFTDRFWRGPFPLPKTKAQVSQDANVDAGLAWLQEQENTDAAV